MNTAKSVASIKIDANLMRQLKADAKADNRSFSNYLETIFLKFGYRPYNQDTYEAYTEAIGGDLTGVVDMSSPEAMLASILCDE